MNTTPSPTREEEKRRKTLLPLFLLLLFILLATSCIVGFLLGRTTEPGRFGALIDTIVLSPEGNDPAPAPSAGTPAGVESPTASVEERITLVGSVRYTDGTPFTDGAVELRSQPRLSTLSEKGYFRFDRVETGDHTISVLDPSGKVLASRELRVARDGGDRSYMEYDALVCVLHVQITTIEIDVELTLDEPAGTLDIKLRDAAQDETRPAFRPSTPPDGEPRPGETAGEPSAAPGVEPSAVPTMEPSTEAAASPSAAPSAEPSTGPGVEPSAEPSASPSNTPITTPSATPTAKPTASSRPSREPDDDDDDDDPVTPRPNPVPAGDTEVYHGDSAVSWTQQAEIDLFRPLDGSPERLIAPGSEGYYLFRLKNGRNEAIHFTMALREGNFHVPLEYRITTDELVPTALTDWQSASVDADTVSGRVPMGANGEKKFRIQWRWPFDGDDTVDTALGEQNDRTYTLKLTIRVEGEG